MDRPHGGFQLWTRRSRGGAPRLDYQAPPPPIEPNKTALLIANAGCDHLPKLRTPIQEARQFGSALKRIGFEVQMLTDGGYDDMLDALHRFEERLRERGGTALFHCGGHGVQVNGVNYLLPVDRNIPDERRVRSLAISADEISGALQGPGARPTSLFWTPAGTTRCPVKPGAPMSAVRRR